MSENKWLATIAGVVVFGVLAASPCLASGEDEAEAPDAEKTHGAPKSDMAIGLTALAAALAVGLCAIATGIAQSRIGSAGCGALAEKPETAGTIILLVAIPETMVILGFVVAVVMLFA